MIRIGQSRKRQKCYSRNPVKYKTFYGDRWIPLTDKASEYIKSITEINKNKEKEDYLFIITESVTSIHSVNIFSARACDEETTIKYCIYSMNDTDRRDQLVRKALTSQIPSQ